MSLDTLSRGITIVTGTDTNVGKTVATAALAAWLRRQDVDLAVVKPAQTGVSPTEDGDLAVVARLAGLPPQRLHEWVRLPDPLAPTTAAHRAGQPLPSITEVARRLTELSGRHQAVLVEGAGGVLVGLDENGHGLLDLSQELDRLDCPARFVVVTRSGLGTLNHTALTLLAIREAGQDPVGLVVGSWPEEPSLAERCNATDLAALAPVLAVLPAGIGSAPAIVSTVWGQLPQSWPRSPAKETL